MALEFLRSMRFLLNVCNQSSTEGNVQNWYSALLALRREISDDMNPKQLAETKNMIDLMHSEVMKITRMGSSSIPESTYWKLDNLEIYLRRIIADTGYKTRKSLDPGQALRA